MHQPATTNPLIIMCINMTIVFAVLIGLSFMIKFIHMIAEGKTGGGPESGSGGCACGSGSCGTCC